jgi:signal transduction histidine kinase
VQEALANVARHAEARTAVVDLAVHDRLLTLTVRDDGRGLSPGWSLEAQEAAGHLGLAGMRERIGALGGAVRVTAVIGGGVAVEARLPVAPVGGLA